MDITRVIPCPVPVTVGESVWLVCGLTLRDMAMLQAYVNARIPDPVAVALQDIAKRGLRNRPRHRRLAEAYEQAETWPPRYGSAEADAVLSTPAGRMFLLSLIADRSGWTADQLTELCETLDAESLDRLELAAFGADPLDVAAALMGLNDQADDSDPINWAEAFADCADATGWTFDDIASMTIGQWLAYRSRGKVDRTVTRPPGVDPDTFRRQLRERFEGLHLPE